MLSNSIIQWLTPIKKGKFIPHPEPHPKKLRSTSSPGMIGFVYHKMFNKAKRNI